MPIELEIPGRPQLSLAHLLVDVNGTLSDRGALIATVSERLRRIADDLTIHLLTADTFGNGREIAESLSARLLRVSDGQHKREHAERLGAEGCVAIGNGANDVPMLERCGLAIAVLGPEGSSARALLASDVVCRTIAEALDLLLSPQALMATLRR